MLAWCRDQPDVRRLAAGSGISQATGYRYLHEGIEVLTAKAPGLKDALEQAIEAGYAYLILDGKIVASDRCAEKTVSRKGQDIDRWYSGKAHHHGGLVQALVPLWGVPLWVSGVLPGGTHDITARELVLPGLRPYLKDRPMLADSGYEGAGVGVHVPVKSPLAEPNSIRMPEPATRCSVPALPGRTRLRADERPVACPAARHAQSRQDRRHHQSVPCPGAIRAQTWVPQLM